MSTKFEEAADAIVSGDIDTLKRLLDENPELIHEKSTREHSLYPSSLRRSKRFRRVPAEVTKERR